MRIYFEDGPLKQIIKDNLPEIPSSVFSADQGVTTCQNILEILNSHPNSKNFVVYTNSIMAFSNKYVWNKELQAPELYIRINQNGKWMRIDHLTNRELREAHNLARMYIAGAFDITNYKREE